MRAGLLLGLAVTLAALPGPRGCGGGASSGSDGSPCELDSECDAPHVCFLGKCRLLDCPDLDCGNGWACIDGLCCNASRCCGLEGPVAEGSCTNGLDDDCDGWTDEEDAGCGAPQCTGNAECADADPCTLDRCQAGQCVHEPSGDCCGSDAECDDANPCTLDSCTAGVCQHEPPAGDCCLGDGTFAAGQPSAGADDGAYISAADLDGDGHLDVIMGTDNEFGVVVLPGVGDGTFGTRRLFSVGSRPWATVAGRFTGGTLSDVAVADGASHQIHLLQNQSTPGNISLALARSFTVGGEPYGITAADFDQDGNLDLAVANRSNDQVNVVLLNADGTQAGTVSPTTAAGPYWVVAADFDADGLPDLAAVGGAVVSVLRNSGAGQFSARIDHAVGADSRHVLAADLDGDQDVDLVAPSAGGASVGVLLGHGDGSFDAVHHFPLVAASAPTWAAAGDFDADGAPDLAVTQNATNAISILIGVGDGFFGAPVDYPTSGRPNSAVIGDFNEDSMLDMVSCDGGSDRITVFLGQGVCY